MPEFTNIKLNGTIRGIGGGLNAEIKQALLNCFAHVAWIDAQGQTYYDALEAALYPPANLLSITAVFNQGSTVIYDNQSLNDLKQYLTVTAHYDNGTTSSVTNYTLSGTLATGTSTITVSYGGKTDTFNVTVTHAVMQYTITNNLTNVSNSNAATVINENLAYSGTLTAASGYVMGTVTVSMGNTDITATAYNSETGAISIASVTGNVTITATAVEDVGWISGVAYASDVINMGDNGYRINSSGELYESGNQADMVSDFIPCRGASAITFPTGRLLQDMWFYDANKVFVAVSSMRDAIENPFPVPVPRDAYYVRVTSRSQTPTLIPYLYDALPANTPYVLNKRYVFDWGDTPETSTGRFTTPKVICYGASSLQASTWPRTFFYFYDGEDNEISHEIRAASATEIEIPAGAVTMNILTEQAGNANNPWFIYTA